MLFGCVCCWRWVVCVGVAVVVFCVAGDFGCLVFIVWLPVVFGDLFGLGL